MSNQGSDPGLTDSKVQTLNHLKKIPIVVKYIYISVSGKM